MISVCLTVACYFVTSRLTCYNPSLFVLPFVIIPYTYIPPLLSLCLISFITIIFPCQAFPPWPGWPIDSTGQHITRKRWHVVPPLPLTNIIAIFFMSKLTSFSPFIQLSSASHLNIAINYKSRPILSPHLSPQSSSLSPHPFSVGVSCCTGHLLTLPACLEGAVYRASSSLCITVIGNCLFFTVHTSQAFCFPIPHCLPR